MGILNKDTIETWILPHLTVGERGFEPTVPLTEIVEAILHRMKTGCQWRELPTKQFFSKKILCWNSVYYHFNRWSKSGCWQKIWVNILASNLKYLDLSSIEFDGSHTPAKNGGDAVGYQGRKACKTTNALFISDNQGVILGMSTPQEGSHHDLFQIQTLFDEICTLLKEANINLHDLFLNADSGFDSKEFQEACQKENIILNVKENPRNNANQDKEPYQSGTHIFDDELYKDRSVIEHSNAWIDGFKALLVRFEFSVRNWMALHFIAFSVIFLRKINKKNKFKQVHFITFKPTSIMAKIHELNLVGADNSNDYNGSLIPADNTAMVATIKQNILNYYSSTWLPVSKSPAKGIISNMTWAKFDALFGTNDQIAFKVSNIGNTSYVKISAIPLSAADAIKLRSATADDSDYFFWDKSVYDAFAAVHRNTVSGLSIYLGKVGTDFKLYLFRSDLGGPAGGPPYAGGTIPNG